MSRVIVFGIAMLVYIIRNVYLKSERRLRDHNLDRLRFCICISGMIRQAVRLDDEEAADVVDGQATIG